MQNTTEIKVLGTGTSKHQMVTDVLKQFLKRADLPIDVIDYTDIDSFLKEGLESIPAVVYNNQVYPIGSNASFNSSLRNVVSVMLKESNYGQIEKIIIPIDFSDVSTNAFAYGHRLATDIGAITKALHVFYPSSKDLEEAATVNIDITLLRESYLKDFVASFDSDWGSDLMKTSIIDSEFATGFPGDKILDSIEDNGAYLTIMGTTGQSGYLKKWFGSVSTKVMNESPAPVLLVPKDANYKGINKIVYAFEDINQDKAIIDDLTSFAGKFDAEIHLVHIDNGTRPNPGYYINELISQKYSSDKVFTVSITNDDVSQSITDYATSNNIDIICLSTHKKGFIEKLYSTSVSKKLATKNIPLLVLKPRV